MEEIVRTAASDLQEIVGRHTKKLAERVPQTAEEFHEDTFQAKMQQIS